ncbi:alkaline phosphatase family protein [Tsuneonella mangrovi]|uniref:alkaline phosphatase family protein n=1 Tax=Tsuneonella mangrovi TaxID=1982042 RepID=UPI000BA24D9B|nr:alkaline phosphatase family protein [Tsuneonella mangrovi]
MIKPVRTALALLVAAVTTPAAAKAPEKPKLIVTLVVDQFAADLFDQYRPVFTGGFKQLSDGVAYVDGYQSHGATETCPGHSTVLTGRHPSSTGIISNTWFDRSNGAWTYCVAVKGENPFARGPQNLKASTLGAWLKSAEPGARVISISGKDRAAIMLGGHDADGEFWWGYRPGFTSSPFADPVPPALASQVSQFNADLLARWQHNPPKFWPAALPADCSALERPEHFGHIELSGQMPPAESQGVERNPAFLRTDAFRDQLMASPLIDRATLELAEHLIDSQKLGQRQATDLLAVSLSSTDYVGHRYGKGGPEMCANLHALDGELAAFFAKLDALGVPYVVALTADHGSLDATERRLQEGLPAHRLDGRQFLFDLGTHLQQALGIDYDPIEAKSPQELWINAPGGKAFHAKIRDAAVAWLQQRPEVRQVFTSAQIAAAVPPPGTPVDKLTMAERAHESYDPQRSGDIFVVLNEFTTPYMPLSPTDAIAGHGSPWDYDRQVPILFWWPGVKAETIAHPIETVDIAPTLAAVAGIATPKLDGRCLDEVAQCSSAARLAARLPGPATAKLP